MILTLALTLSELVLLALLALQLRKEKWLTNRRLETTKNKHLAAVGQ